MANHIEFLPGPKVSKTAHDGGVTREDAEAGLVIAAKKRKATAYALEEMDGHWVAALVREADLPFNGPSDDSEGSPDPKSEGPGGGGDPSTDDDGSDPSSDGPPSPDGPPSDDSGDDKKDKHKGGDEDHIVHQMFDIVKAIGDALGVPTDLGQSPVPGMDDQGGPPPGGPMGGPPGPPAGPPGMGNDKEVVRHERALKPGETPPGSAPVGSPAFSSVRPDHPWAHLAGKTASFKASIPLGENDSIVDATKHVASLAHEIGYNHQVREGVDENGQRIAVALVTAHPID